MKQEGRTEQELTESYCFLFPDKSKVGWLAKPRMHIKVYLKREKLDRVNGFCMNLSFVFPDLAPVDLRKGSVRWTLSDYYTRKSING